MLAPPKLRRPETIADVSGIDEYEMAILLVVAVAAKEEEDGEGRFRVERRGKERSDDSWMTAGRLCFFGSCL